jgi:hypothetical protein
VAQVNAGLAHGSSRQVNYPKPHSARPAAAVPVWAGAPRPGSVSGTMRDLAALLFVVCQPGQCVGEGVGDAEVHVSTSASASHDDARRLSSSSPGRG